MKRLLSAMLLCAATWASAAPRTLEVWIMPNGANPQGILEERMVQFRKETGIAAKVVVLDWGEAWSRITGALEQGQGPDVVQLGTTWVSYMASKGYLAPLDKHLAEIRSERFVETSWKTTQVDGNPSVYAVPWFMDVRVLMGNKRLLDSMGIKPSQVASYRGYRDALRKLRDARISYADGTPVAPYGFPGKSDWNIPHNFAPWIWSEGGDFIKKENGKWHSALLEPHTVMGIHKYLRFVLDTLIESATLRDNTAQVAQRFNNGEQVFVLNTSEVIMQTRIPESEGGLMSSRIGTDGVEAFPVPAGPGGSVSFVGGSDLALPQYRKDDPEALKLLLFLTRPDNLDLYTRKIGFLPPDQEVQKVWAQDEGYRVLVEQAKNGRAYPNIPMWGDVESALISMFGSIWSMLDVGGLYSDEALYQTLVQYDSKINGLLGAPTRPTPTFDEFQKMLIAVDAEAAVNAPPSSVTAVAPVRNQGWTYAQKGGLVLALLVLVGGGLAFLLRRKD